MCFNIRPSIKDQVRWLLSSIQFYMFAFIGIWELITSFGSNWETLLYIEHTKVQQNAWKGPDPTYNFKPNMDVKCRSSGIYSVLICYDSRWKQIQCNIMASVFYLKTLFHARMHPSLVRNILICTIIVVVFYLLNKCCLGSGAILILSFCLFYGYLISF